MKDKKQKQKKIVIREDLSIEDPVEVPRWKKLKCKCAQDPNDIEHRYPILDCYHCKFEIRENSIPQEPFDLTMGVYDKNLKKTGSTIKHITHIKIDRGDKYDDVRGWTC